MTIQQMLIAGGKSTVLLTISSNRSTTYNVFTSAGSPVSPVDITLTISPGVYIDANPGINATGAWPAGSSLTIINDGYITGSGGNGGNGGDYNTNGFSGNDGGDALTLGLNTIIDNTDGFIFGGGGGGGGGGGHQVGLGAAGGGGGGGGQGYVGSSGGTGGAGGGGNEDAAGANGGNGDFNAAGTGGAGGDDGFYPVVGAAGGNGGNWGTAGSSGLSSPSRSGGSGGAAGKAIDLNGFTVTFLGGNNATRVKGAVS